MRRRKSVFMGTTGISADKSASEVSAMLARAGAEQVMTKYENGEAIGLTFLMTIEGQKLGFRLPLRVEALFKVLNGQRPTRTQDRKAETDREQANRIAWRQIVRWVEAQIAIIDTGMVHRAEVFMPYMVESERGPTMFEAYAKRQKLLPNLDEGEKQ